MGHYECSFFFQGGLTRQKPDQGGTQQHGMQGYYLILAAFGGYSSSIRAVLASKKYPTEGSLSTMCHLEWREASITLHGSRGNVWHNATLYAQKRVRATNRLRTKMLRKTTTRLRPLHYSL